MVQVLSKLSTIFWAATGFHASRTGQGLGSGQRIAIVTMAKLDRRGVSILLTMADGGGAFFFSQFQSGYIT